MTTNQENAGKRIGSLFSGYGGLDLAVEAVTGAETAWVSDIDKGARKILAHRFPHAPNIGDISKVDWSTVEPVDIVTGGFPCQDVSHAGKRAGMHEGTRTGLWSYMRDAIDQLRPSLVVAENVRGLLSAEAASDVEPCPWCLGDGEGEPSMRALGAVHADLADIGYDAQWCGLRAADVGAPHGRFRVFVVAYPKSHAGRVGYGDRRAAAVTDRLGGQRSRPARGWRPGPANGDIPHPDATELGCRPTGRDNRVRTAGLVQIDWGVYEPAIRRWEALTVRSPAPTELSARGTPRLSPAFVEWLMGLPAGWVCDVPDLTRNEQLHALGNGVVPPQAAAALRHLLGALEQAA